MRWNALFGTAATLAFLLPVVLLLLWRLYLNRSLLALLLYCSLSFLFNLMAEGWLPVSMAMRRGFSTLYSYLDAPLMLIFLLFFCVQQRKRQVLLLTLAALLTYEGIVAVAIGFSARAIPWLLGPGILCVLVHSFVLSLQQIKQTVLRNRRSGNTLLVAAILFTYGSHALLYVFYFLVKTPAVSDVFLLYYITAIIFGAALSIGLYYVRQKARELEDLKVTRKELELFFDT